MRRDLAMSVLASFLIPLVAGAQGAAATCAPDNAGLTLPAGFCAGIFADSIRGARQLVIAANGDVFVAQQGRGTTGVVALRDAGKTGRATMHEQFASGFSASHVVLFDGHLFTDARTGGGRGGPPATVAILRYPLKPGELTPGGPPDTVVTGIPGSPDHFTRNFVIARDGALYVNVGSQTNACQENNRAKGSPGKTPCTELDTRAGIWKFDARAKDQTQAKAVHFARGIRNAVGIALNPLDGKLWTTQHGRDQLGGQGGNWNFDDRYNSENPAEELLQVSQGDDFGWPYCYYSNDLHKLVLAPEYGGDGKKVEQCAQKKEPVAAFPGHWAPNALLFYTGSMLPARYKNGAFIAFHGSWNRTEGPQGGFNIVFQPLKDGKAAGAYEIFADGFAQGVGTGRATANNGIHRPAVLAQGPDGSLYVTDDFGGRIYRIVYTGK